MKRSVMPILILSAFCCGVASAEPREDTSPVVATINGEPVTKLQWNEVWKADQWHAQTLKAKSGFAEKMQGKPYEDFFFKEEFVKIRAMAQRYKDTLPQMKAAIEAIHQQAVAGEDFAALATKYSQDQGSAVNGGDLGEPKQLHEMVFPFNRVALSMKEGEISEPILTYFGYHILKIDKVFPAGMDGKGKRVAVRNILIKYPTQAAREESETVASQAKVEVLDKALCKKLVSFCAQEK